MPFDNPFYQPGRFMPDAQLPNRCRREERPGGVIINLDTGQRFSSMDACVTHGATLGYDSHSHAESVKAVTDCFNLKRPCCFKLNCCKRGKSEV
jgi:hypothetical protein